MPEITYVTKPVSSDLVLCTKNQVPYFAFKDLLREPWLVHGFSTRLGGVSSGVFSSMNLGFHRGDPDRNVQENYRRIGDAIGFDWKRVVHASQTHTTNIRIATEADAGKGTICERDYQDIDATITDVPGLPLAIFTADCVPVLFADSKTHTVAAAHSGWRGTAGAIGAKVVKKMEEEFASRPEDILAAIGPSICRDCFEIGPEVVHTFIELFGKNVSDLIHPGKGDRSFLDLWELNRRILLDAGLLPENIHVTNVCTRCNPTVFYSHRLMGKERGNLASFIMRTT